MGRLTVTLTNRSGDNSDLKLDPAGVLQIYFEMLTPDDIANIKVPETRPGQAGPTSPASISNCIRKTRSTSRRKVRS